MSFLSSFKKLLGIGADERKKGAANRYLITDKDPSLIWEIIGELGDGAFGKVYKAQNRENGTFAALKQVEINADDELEDFIVEIDILHDCRHENVVGIHEAYFYNHKLWMLIEFCGGGAVDSIMVDLEKPLREDQIRYIGYEMLKGLDFIHKKHVIHRDLKAGNVLLTLEGDVKLADFGVSAYNPRSLPRRDSFIGTPYWMAPEVILCETLKDTPYTSKADIWSFGVTLIEMAQIEPPNHDMHPMRVLIKIQKAEPPTLDNKSKWSKEFSDLLKICLVKDPEQRPTAELLMQHPFFNDLRSKKSIVDLISEARAEVIETVEDLTEDEDIKEYKKHQDEDSVSVADDRVSLASDVSDKREKTPDKHEQTPERKISEEKSVTPERPKTPDTDAEKPKIPSPKKQAPRPPSDQERTPTPPPASVIQDNRRSASPKPSEKEIRDEEQKASPREEEDVSPGPEKPETSVALPADTISPPPQFAEDVDKSSDEGIGASGDEKSDTSSQNGSPSKMTDIQIDITPLVTDIVDDMIDEVLSSTKTNPSVPSVVFETIDSVIEEQTEEDDMAEKEAEKGAKDAVPGSKRQNSVSEIISSLEKIRDANDSDSPRSKSESPSRETRRGSTPLRQLSVDKSIKEEEEEEEVKDTNVSTKVGDNRTPSEEREMEIQSIKVRVSDDEEEVQQEENKDVKGEESIQSSNIDDVITINGHPVPAAATIIVNGHVTRIGENKNRDKSPERKTTSANTIVSGGGDFNKGLVPQTDLDTLETKHSSAVEPLDISNPDDEESDQRSDTGSINTVDSVEKEEPKESPRDRQRRAGHIRPRNNKQSQYRTLTKTRTFVVNGEVVTSTTQKVVLAGQEHRQREEHLSRKQDLRELKLLQKNENKQYQDLIYKSQMAREVQDRKFEADMQALVKNYEQDMDTLTKQQKQQVEKAESSQSIDLKAAAKRIKVDQEKEFKIFKEKQKQDIKLMKQEFDMLAKTSKKEDVRKKKEQKEIQLQDEERQFMENQLDRMDKHMKQLTETHRQKIAMLESQFLQQKQQLLRAREAAIWDLEKQQLHEKHQLAKSQLKDMFFLKRHQMLTRHQKEIEQMKRSNLAKESEMQSRHALEKKRLPKILKQESKTRSLMFKQSLRLSIAGSPDDERSKLKQFEENEKKRMKAEQVRQETKHKKQWEELVYRNETSLHELEQLQAEKRKMLMEHETQKIKELDEQYSNELREWKNMLAPRKKRLEDEFAKQKEEQEKFYGAVVMTGDNTYMPRSSVSGSTRHKPDDSLRSRHSTVI